MRRQWMALITAGIGLLSLSAAQAAAPCYPKPSSPPVMDIFYQSEIRTKTLPGCSDIKSSSEQDIAGYDGSSLTAYAGTAVTHTLTNNKKVSRWIPIAKAKLTKEIGQPLKANYYDGQNKLLLTLTKNQLSNPLTFDKPWADKYDNGEFRKRSLPDIPNTDRDLTSEQVRIRMSAAFRRTIAEWFASWSFRIVPAQEFRVAAGSTPSYDPSINNAENISIHWDTLSNTAIIGNEPPHIFSVQFSVLPNTGHPNPNMRGTRPLIYNLYMVRDFRAPTAMNYRTVVTLNPQNVNGVSFFDSSHIRYNRPAIALNADLRNRINNFNNMIYNWNARIKTAAGGGNHTGIAEALSAGSEHALATNIIPPAAPRIWRMPFNFINAVLGCRLMQDVVLSDPLPSYYFPPEIHRMFINNAAQMDLLDQMEELRSFIIDSEISGWPWLTFRFDDANQDHRRLIGHSHDVPIVNPDGSCTLCEKPGIKPEVVPVSSRSK